MPVLPGRRWLPGAAQAGAGDRRPGHRWRLQANVFAENSVEGVEADLDMFEHLEGWIRERRALAHEMAVQGMQFDHHTLVEKIGTPEIQRQERGRHRRQNPCPHSSSTTSNLFDTKLKSPAGLEKAIGKKAVEHHLADLIIRPVTGTDLIRNTHIGRTTAQR